MKNTIKKNNSPDFEKIQQTLAAEWLERSKKEEHPDAAEISGSKSEDAIFSKLK